MTQEKRNRPGVAAPGGGNKLDNKGQPVNRPPHEAASFELLVIGAIIQEPRRVLPICVDRGITAACFTDSLARSVWESVCELNPDVTPISALSVAKRLNRPEIKNQLDQIATAAAPDVVEYYADELRQRERPRALAAALEAQGGAIRMGGSLRAVAASLHSLADDAAAIADRRASEIRGADDAADYIEAEPPPLDPIISGGFERGDKAEVIGGSKQRKTFFTLLLTLHLAMGRNWIGLEIPKRRRVLYVNLELKRDWFHRRIREACRVLGIGADDLRGWFRVVNARASGASIRSRLVEIVARESPDIVVIDPRYKLHKPGEDENAGMGLQGILDLLDQVAESGPAVLVVHHDPKGEAGDRSIQDRGGGSGWAGRDTDARFALSKQRTEPETATLVSLLFRNYPPREDFVIRWVDGTFHLAPDLPAVPFTTADRVKTARASQAMGEDAALNVLGDETGTAEEVRQRLRGKGVKKAEADDLVKRLVLSGRWIEWRPPTKNPPKYVGPPAAMTRRKAEVMANLQGKLPA